MRSHVRRERVHLWLLGLLLCSCTTALAALFPAAQGAQRRRLLLDGDDGGDHVSNGGTCSMLVDGESAT